MEKQPSPYYIDEAYIKSHSLQCKLLVQHAENRLLLLIIDHQKNIRYLAETTVDQFINQPVFFDNLKFGATELLTIPDSFAFMPFELEDKKSQHNYDSLLLSDEQEHILHEKMFHHEIDNRFTVRETAYALQKRLGGARLIPSSNVLIKCVADVSQPAQAIFGIHFYEQEFEMAYFDNQKFTFYNRFPMAHVDDFNYFLLAVLEQFTIATGQAIFYLSGEITAEDETYSRILKYSKDIHFFPVDDTYRVSAVPEQHRFGLLMALASCVLLEEH